MPAPPPPTKTNLANRDDFLQSIRQSSRTTLRKVEPAAPKAVVAEVPSDMLSMLAGALIQRRQAHGDSDGEGTDGVDSGEDDDGWDD